MIDFLVPPKKSLIKSKEMHGHVILDIHNTKSGFTERIEKHNTVTTNANEYMWLNYLARLRSGDCERPTNMYQGLYGGVVLFRDAITGGSMLPFGNNPYIGYAGTSTDMSGNRGVFNEAESNFDIEDGEATTVWDWGTSQANGTIGSVARTHYKVGDGYFGERGHSGYKIGYYTVADSTSTRYILIGVDKANNKAYLRGISDYAYYEYDYNATLSIESGTFGSGYLIPTTSMVTHLCDTTSTSYQNYCWLDVDNQKIYRVGVNTSGSSNDGVISVYCTDLTAGTIEDVETQVTLAGTYLTSGDYASRCISDGYIYLSGYNPSDVSKYGVYQIKISDNTVSFFDLDQVFTNYGYTLTGGLDDFVRWGTGGVSIRANGTKSGASYIREIVFDQDGTAHMDEPNFATGNNNYAACNSLGAGTGADVPIISLEKDESYNSTNYNIYTTYDYLATYCNLDTPVTKTSSETLKLTYTLSDS